MWSLGIERMTASIASATSWAKGTETYKTDYEITIINQRKIRIGIPNICVEQIELIWIWLTLFITLKRLKKLKNKSFADAAETPPWVSSEWLSVNTPSL